MPSYSLVDGGVPAVLRGLGKDRIGDMHLCWGKGTLHDGHTSDHLGLADDPDAAEDGELFSQATAMRATVEVYKGPLSLDLCFRGNDAMNLTASSIEAMRKLVANASVDPADYPLSVGLWPYYFAVDEANHPSIGDLLDVCSEVWKAKGVQWASFPGFNSDIPHAGMPEAEWKKIPDLLSSRGLELYGVAAFNHESAPHTGDSDTPWREQFSTNLRFTLVAYGQDHSGTKLLRVDGVEDPAVLGERKGFPAAEKTVDPAQAFKRWVANLQWACDEAAKVGVTLVYEGEPGFVYHTLQEWIELHAAVDRKNFKYQPDWSHLDHAARGTKFELAA